MCFFSAPSVPPMPAPPPAPPPVPTTVDPDVRHARDQARRAAAARAGYASTIRTSGLGDPSAGPYDVPGDRDAGRLRRQGAAGRVTAMVSAKPAGLDRALRAHCQRRLESLRRERASWEPHWRELSEHILPRRGRFLWTPNAGDRGRKLNGKILNSAGTLAARTLASGMVSGITSPTRPWFRLTLPDKRLASLPSVRAWLDEVQGVLLRIFAASNFYNAIGTAYEELGVFGTAVIVVLEDYEDVARFYTLTIGEYFLAASHRGVVDTLYREFPLSVGAAVQEYGLEAVSRATAEKYRAGRLDDEVLIVHAIEPNDRRIVDVSGTRADAANMAWRSIHFESASDDETRPLLRIGGYRRFCVTGPRWAVTGNDVYGRSPGMDALADVKALQAMERDMARAVALIVKPPMVGPPALRGEAASIVPGSITYVASAQGTDQFRPAFTVSPRIEALQASIDRRARQVMEAFYADLFLMLSGMDGVQPRNAIEILERREEKMLQLGPVLERLHDELLDPLIRRVLEIAGNAATPEHSILPPRPPELEAPEVQGRDLEVEYVSTLSVAQKAAGTAGIERFVAFVGRLGAVVPEALDKLDIDRTLDAYADLLTVPAAIVADGATVAARREARAREAAGRKVLEATLAGVNGAKVLSETDVGGGMNALQRILGAAAESVTEAGR